MSSDLEELKQSSSRRVEVGDQPVHYHDIGEGPVVVMLHGGGPGASGWSNFSFNVERLSREHRLLLIDQLGYGETPWPEQLPEGRSVEEVNADLVLAVLDDLGVPVADFVGNSQGGVVSLVIALDQPTRARRLVLMGSGGGQSLFGPAMTRTGNALVEFVDPPGPSIEKMQRIVDVMTFDSTPFTELVAERYEAAIEPTRLAAFAQIAAAARQGLMRRTMGLSHEVHLVEQPALLLWGTDDRVLPFDMGIWMARRMPDARLVLLPRTGHWVQMERPEEFCRLVESFLA